MGRIEMILEITNSSIQLVVLGFLVIWAARQTREAWLFRLIIGAFGCYFLGSLFWELYLLVRTDWPQGFSVSELAFYGFYCFFIAIALKLREKWTDGQWAEANKHKMAALFGPLVVIAFHTVYFLLWGELVIDILSGVILSLLFYHTLLGYFAGGGYKRYHCMVLIVFTLELLVLLTGIFVDYGDPYSISYNIFSYIQMAAWFFIIPAARKGADV